MANNPKYHDHVGHMIFSNKYAICEGCEQMWKTKWRPPNEEERENGIDKAIRAGWYPEDNDRKYRGSYQTTQWRGKRKKK